MRLILTKYQLSFTKGKIVKDSIILYFYVLRLVQPQIYNTDHRNKSNNYKKKTNKNLTWPFWVSRKHTERPVSKTTKTSYSS